MVNSVSVKECARALGRSEQFIRISLQKELLPIGYAIKLSGNRYSYYISPLLLFNYTGYKAKGDI